MKLWIAIGFGIIIAILGWGMYDLKQERGMLESDVDTLRWKVEGLKSDNSRLQSDIEYLKNPENLVKELKSQFNYRAPDEKLLIIVPNTTGARP